MTTGGEDYGFGEAWCPTCRRKAYLADTYETDKGDERTFGASRTERVHARPLQCGHDAGDTSAPYVNRRRPDPGLVGRVVDLQGQPPS